MKHNSQMSICRKTMSRCPNCKDPPWLEFALLRICWGVSIPEQSLSCASLHPVSLLLFELLLKSQPLPPVQSFENQDCINSTSSGRDSESIASRQNTSPHPISWANFVPKEARSGSRERTQREQKALPTCRASMIRLRMDGRCVAAWRWQPASLWLSR